MRVRAGNQWLTWNLTETGRVIEVRFGFNRAAINLIKTFKGARWHPDKKIWTISKCQRNMFQLKHLAYDPKIHEPEESPYHWYDQDLERVTSRRPLYDHQIDMLSHVMTYKRVLLAAEMGTGKTLVAYEAMERVPGEWWWIGPKSALAAVELELYKWDIRIRPTFMTYERLVRVMAGWGTKMAPRGVVFDECSKIKNEAAQRSKAALALAEGVREDHEDGYLILMSGAPSPKDPSNWWHQCEVACPGFIREGTAIKLKKRLAIIDEATSLVTGAVYPRLVAWRDDENKCNICGALKSEHEEDHAWVPSRNEVLGLYKRLRGLVQVKLKKDCMDLPEKQYRLIECPPSKMIQRFASLIKSNSTRAVTALTLLRELSDGFQYKDVASGETKTCPECSGTCRSMQVTVDDAGHSTGEEDVVCSYCSGSGSISISRREVEEIPTPKDDILQQILGEHEEVGRLVVYAGFTGSIDKCRRLIQSCGWDVIQVDGRGWTSSLDLKNSVEMLLRFQEGSEVSKNKICFLGHPGSAGMGLTLTASPTILFYSNSFNADDRIQAEDRIHRIGMDENRGATIIDIIHLDTDRLVLENLRKKRELQALSMGDLEFGMNHAEM